VAAVGTGAALGWRDTLQRHLEAIQKRDLDALADTIADPLVVIASDGKLLRTAADFLKAHRDWFGMPHWSLHATPVEIQESAGMGYAVLHLLYCEDAPGKPALREQSHLTLIFEKRDGRWLMVLDQNTPIT
jgi:uncharacterized protein (TIGR02246 family)